MKTLSIDLETYSEMDIRTVGVYKYAENSDILLFAYAFGDEPVQIIDMARLEPLPDEVVEALYDPNILKTAYNAQFEINVLNNWLTKQGLDKLDTNQWSCTMVLSYTLGLPGSLDALGKVLRLGDDKQKLAIGKRLIQYFCKPCKPTKVNGGRLRNHPCHDPEKWELFKTYCMRDVESERTLRKKMSVFSQSEEEHRLWVLDQQINSNGVLIDFDLVRAAIQLDREIKDKAMAQLKAITGLDNPNSNQQFIAWFEGQEGYRLDTLDKEKRKELLQDKSLKATTRKAISLKDLISKTSVKKYIAMENMACRDNRVKGMLQFYGASRTGRWAGRGVQLQNLPQNHLDDLADARDIVKACDLDYLEMFYSHPADTLSQLIRTAFIAPKGSRFVVADFSAIEARVIAWLADEKWRMEVFAKGGDIYCASATQMFHVPVVKHGVNGELRQKGKVAELACGYGGGVNALKAFGADKLGMTEEEMKKTIVHWRNASPHICALWGDLEGAAKKAVKMKGRVRTKQGLWFSFEKGFLFITLPSGRRIAYPKPKIIYEPEYDRESLTYETAGVTGGWGKCYTWGGKLTENVVQAIARDCLAESMLRLADIDCQIVMHVHDEVIIEAPYNSDIMLDRVAAIMGKPIPWAEGLLLRADGYETEFYMKD